MQIAWAANDYLVIWTVNYAETRSPYWVNSNLSKQESSNKCKTRIWIWKSIHFLSPPRDIRRPVYCRPSPSTSWLDAGCLNGDLTNDINLTKPLLFMVIHPGPLLRSSHHVMMSRITQFYFIFTFILSFSLSLTGFSLSCSGQANGSSLGGNRQTRWWSRSTISIQTNTQRIVRRIRRYALLLR